MTGELWLEDIHVGHQFRTDVYNLTADDIIEFATKWDPQPFHLSDETAQDTFFHGLAGSGWHTAAITMRLLVTSGIALARGIIGASGEVAWPTATRPGRPTPRRRRSRRPAHVQVESQPRTCHHCFRYLEPGRRGTPEQQGAGAGVRQAAVRLFVYAAFQPRTQKHPLGQVCGRDDRVESSTPPWPATSPMSERRSRLEVSHPPIARN
jgi:hypothetical protein